MGAAALFFALLPCILLATALSDGVINTALGLIAGTLAFLIYLHLPKGAVRRLYALLAIPALYLLSGGYFWLFAGWVIAAEWLEGRRFANWTWSFLFAALAFATPVAARRWLFVVPLRSAFLQPTVFFQPGRPPTPAMVVYGYLALLMPAVLLCKRWVLPFWERAFARARPAPAAGRRLRFVAAGAAAALLAVLTVDLQWVCYDANLSDYAEYREPVPAETMGRYPSEGGDDGVARVDEAVFHQLRSVPQGAAPGRTVSLPAGLGGARPDP